MNDHYSPADEDFYNREGEAPDDEMNMEFEKKEKEIKSLKSQLRDRDLLIVELAKFVEEAGEGTCWCEEQTHEYSCPRVDKLLAQAKDPIAAAGKIKKRIEAESLEKAAKDFEGRKECRLCGGPETGAKLLREWAKTAFKVASQSKPRTGE